MIKISYKLDKKQAELLDLRSTRQLYKLCPEAKLHSLIGAAVSKSELASVIKKYGLSDACDFTGLHISVCKRLTDCIVTALYMYPKLRRRICFIGSYTGYLNMLDKVEAGEDETLKTLGVQYILSKSSAATIGRKAKKMVGDPGKDDGQNTLAQSILFCGILDGIILDDNDFGRDDIRRIKVTLESDELAAFAPKGCNTVESVIFHEIGHLLDFLCNVCGDRQLLSEFNSATAEEIKSGLSEYAATSIGEYIAEGFSEYMSVESPRPAAKRVKEAIDRRYNRLG